MAVTNQLPRNVPVIEKRGEEDNLHDLHLHLLEMICRYCPPHWNHQAIMAMCETRWTHNAGPLWLKWVAMAMCETRSPLWQSGRLGVKTLGKHFVCVEYVDRPYHVGRQNNIIFDVFIA